MKPNLNGRWQGKFSHPSFEFDADMQLHQEQSGAVSGVILWRMLKAPGAQHESKIGLTAKEYVGGLFDAKSRSIMLNSVKIDDPKQIGIDPDSYSLKLSADGKLLEGGSTAHRDGNGRFSARLAPNSTQTASQEKALTTQNIVSAPYLLFNLEKAQSFDDAQQGERPGGYSPNYKVYESLLNFQPPVSVSKLSALVEHGSPAARLYAAMLINAQDAAAGKKALTKLTTDKSPVSFSSGCIVTPVTVKEVAQSFLGKGNYMHFALPKPKSK